MVSSRYESSSTWSPCTSMKRWPTGLMNPIRGYMDWRAAKSPRQTVVLPSFIRVAATKTRRVTRLVGAASSGRAGWRKGLLIGSVAAIGEAAGPAQGEP